MTISTTDSPTEHSPSEWEDHARELEKRGLWGPAMTAWRKAMSASAGHGRRARYETEAERCLREAQKP